MLLKIIIGFYILLNLTLLILMKVDKIKAQAGKWRIPEKTLLLLGFFGGFLGGILGMQLFRHKTHKLYFHLTYYISVIVHIALWIFLFNKFGGTLL